MAKDIKVRVVKTSMMSQGLFFIKSDKSSITVDFCSAVGTIRSLVVTKVMSNMIVHNNC